VQAAKLEARPIPSIRAKSGFIVQAAKLEARSILPCLYPPKGMISIRKAAEWLIKQQQMAI